MYPQVLLNVAVPNGFDWKKHQAIKTRRRDAERSLNGKGRVLLRPSGTEPVLRVMVEGEPREAIESAAKSIAAAVEVRRPRLAAPQAIQAPRPGARGGEEEEHEAPFDRQLALVEHRQGGVPLGAWPMK